MRNLRAYDPFKFALNEVRDLEILLGKRSVLTTRAIKTWPHGVQEALNHLYRFTWSVYDG